MWEKEESKMTAMFLAWVTGRVDLKSMETRKDAGRADFGWDWIRTSISNASNVRWSSSGNATLKADALVCWLLWTGGIWGAADAGRGFRWAPLICLRTDPPKGIQLSWIPSPGISSTREEQRKGDKIDTSTDRPSLTLLRAPPRQRLLPERHLTRPPLFAIHFFPSPSHNLFCHRPLEVPSPYSFL